MPLERVQRTIAECLRPVRVKTAPLQTRDYQLAGRYPVIDQGQKAVAGWTDNADAVVFDDLPMIV